jgi:membrane protease YdiL (CAAX protease family)
MSRPRVIREIALYVLVVYALALGIAVALPGADVNLLLTVVAPTVTVAILTLVATPSGERGALWRSLALGRSRGDGSAWLAALAVPVLLVTLAYGAAVALGVGRLHPLTLSPASIGDWVANLVIGMIIGTVIILGEEIGWRGYLLPRVQQLTSRRRAAVLTGFVHGCFHLPLILVASTYDAEGSRWLVAPIVVVTITAAGVFYAYVRDRSGSTWAVAVAHNAANTFFDMGAVATSATGSTAALAYVAGESGLATMAAVIAVAAFLLTRSRGWQENPAATSAPNTTGPELEKLPAAV